LREDIAALNIVTNIRVQLDDPAGNTRADIDPIGGNFALHRERRRSGRDPHDCAHRGKDCQKNDRPDKLLHGATQDAACAVGW